MSGMYLTRSYIIKTRPLHVRYKMQIFSCFFSVQTLKTLVVIRFKKLAFLEGPTNGSDALKSTKNNS